MQFFFFYCFFQDLLPFGLFCCFDSERVGKQRFAGKGRSGTWTLDFLAISVQTNDRKIRQKNSLRLQYVISLGQSRRKGLLGMSQDWGFHSESTHLCICVSDAQSMVSWKIYRTSLSRTWNAWPAKSSMWLSWLCDSNSIDLTPYIAKSRPKTYQSTIRAAVAAQRKSTHLETERSWVQIPPDGCCCFLSQSVMCP